MKLSEFISCLQEIIKQEGDAEIDSIIEESGRIPKRITVIKSDFILVYHYGKEIVLRFCKKTYKDTEDI